MPQRTSDANIARIDAMFDALLNTMGNLAARWADEKDHEDIKDFQSVIERALAKRGFDFTVTKMRTRPFGFEFTIGTEAVYLYTITVGGRAAWERLK